MRRLLIAAVLVVSSEAFGADAGAVPPPIQFTTVQVGTPDPVAPGGIVTWFLQGLNEGTETLTDIGWSHPDCGSQLYPGPFPTGVFTPSFECQLPAPLSGQAVLEVQWTATVMSTGEVLTPLVRTTVEVEVPPTSTAAPTSAPGSTAPPTTAPGTTATSSSTTAAPPTSTSQPDPSAPPPTSQPATSEPPSTAPATTEAPAPPGGVGPGRGGVPTTVDGLPVTGRSTSRMVVVAAVISLLGLAVVLAARRST